MSAPSRPEIRRRRTRKEKDYAVAQVPGCRQNRRRFERTEFRTASFDRRSRRQMEVELAPLTVKRDSSQRPSL
jgi:hypothetical protein